MPYDEFTIEQLAGDLLPGATLEQKIATGFHRNTLFNHEGGVDQEQFRVEAVVDRTNTTAEVFLGLTMGCAHCHDHKYDPFSSASITGSSPSSTATWRRTFPLRCRARRSEYRKNKAEYDQKVGGVQGDIDDYRKKRAAGRRGGVGGGAEAGRSAGAAAGRARALLIEPAKRARARRRPSMSNTPKSIRFWMN